MTKKEEKENEMCLDEALKRLGKPHLIREEPEAVPVKKVAQSSLEMLLEELSKENQEED